MIKTQARGRWADRLQAAWRAWRPGLLAAAAIVLGAAAARADCADARHWVDYTDPDFGIEMELPIDCFYLQPPAQARAGHLFVSSDGQSRLAVYATDQAPAPNPAGLKRFLTQEVGGYEDVTYAPSGRSWLVLSGYRGETIFYEKYMFTAGGQVMSSFWVTFPRDQKPIFDPIIGRMEDSFRPSRR